jgi:hypothetical protein
MPQIYDIGQAALLPLRAESFFALKSPTASAGFEPKASTLPLDYRSRSTQGDDTKCFMSKIVPENRYLFRGGPCLMCLLYRAQSENLLNELGQNSNTDWQVVACLFIGF